MSQGSPKRRWLGPFEIWWLSIGAVVVGGTILSVLVFDRGTPLLIAVVTATYVGLPSAVVAVRKLTGGDEPPSGEGDQVLGVGPLPDGVIPPSYSAPVPNSDVGNGGRVELWDVRLNPVVRALAGALRDPRTIESIAQANGLDLAELDPGGKPRDKWQQVMELAYGKSQATLDRIHDMALDRTENRNLHEAVRIYRAQRTSK